MFSVLSVAYSGELVREWLQSNNFPNNFYVYYPIATKFVEIIYASTVIVFTKLELSCIKIILGIRFLLINLD